MLQNFNSIVIISILLVHFFQIIENGNADGCPSLLSTATRNVTCKYNNKTLNNCSNPLEGTEAFLSCNQFYEEDTIEMNPNCLCKDGKWNRPIPECYPSCGTKPSKGSSNLLNEQDVNLKNPWHIGIYNDTKKLICEGTLITMNLVLTAADCISYEYNSTIYLINDTYVASGKMHPQYFDKRDKFAQFSKVNNLVVPEKYKGSTGSYAFDIAILVLSDPFYPSQVVQPVCINFNNLSYNSSFVDDRKVTSWIYTHENTSTVLDELREMAVIHIPYSVYHAHLQSHRTTNYNITFDKIFGIYLNNDDTCHGNKGVGLLAKDVINNRYYITGIRSVQIRRVIECNSPHYIEYTSIIQYLEFLKNHIMSINKIQNCLLPSFPPNGAFYVLMNSNVESEYEPTFQVAPLSTLTLTCNMGYNFTSPKETKYYCSNNGQWTPNLGGCSHASPLKDKPAGSNSIYGIVIPAVAGVLAIALVPVIIFKVKKERKIRRELKSAGLFHFEHGNLKKFNPQLGIGDQADLLPYNTNFEFPRDKVKLGKQLGSGAFGIVMKADAYGIIPKEEKTTVAVKIVKDAANNIQIKSLILELKIMVHLGQHLNVVNLLGACTKNILKRELLVIAEYCPFGNLYDYLLESRPSYVNQVNSATGNIYYSYGPEDLENVVSISNDQKINISGSNIYYNPIESKSRSNSRGDNRNDIKPVYTKDLISWSFQVACGMDYLSSRKVIHGDLAARNILLAENNIVKICDFGLAKIFYQNTNYKKKEDSPLPIKWMAIESIRDGVFSTKSDVWSYAIVLWEFFSLSQSPYPGIEADERLYQKLMEGYKMESPPYAPKEMYKIMCDCWETNSESRPSFNKLASRVGLMLEENIRQHYIDLNDPYFIINTERLKNGEKDYLALLGRTDSSYTNKTFQSDDVSIENVGNGYITPS